MTQGTKAKTRDLVESEAILFEMPPLRSVGPGRRKPEGSKWQYSKSERLYAISQSIFNSNPAKSQ